MKRLLLWVIGLGVMLCVQGMPVSAVSANNNTIEAYDVKVTLGRDTEKRSYINVTEKIATNFIKPGVSHGLSRAFVTQYDGHKAPIEITSVKDGQGNNLSWHWVGDELRIGNKDKYVHGLQVYVISYTQRDVTKHFADTKKDEFYWDVIGTGWPMSIANATTEVRVTDELASLMKSKPVCYMGKYGSKNTCTVKQDNATTFSAVSPKLQSYEGMSYAIGFGAGTFAAHKESLQDVIVKTLLMLFVISSFIVGPVVLTVGLIFFWVKHRNTRSSEIRGILERATTAEYVPPRGRSVLESEVIRAKQCTSRALTAQIIDLAVRHYIEIRQTKEKGLFGSAEYTLRLIKAPTDLLETEKRAIYELFASEEVGSEVSTTEMKAKSAALLQLLRTTTEEVKASELFVTDEAVKKWFNRVGFILLGTSIVLLSVPIFILAVVAWVMAGSSSLQYSVIGADLKKYLEGLELYIKVAETERLKMLQSPEGAEKVGEIAGDTGALVKLYEKVLPYAVLFGQEKEWAKQLGKLYEDSGTTPGWTSFDTFNAVMFASMINDFSSVASTASDYSSSGGSDGGGFSGGGGGGGGGGDW